MRTAMARQPVRARSYALRGVAWSLGIFGLLRLSWVETHGLGPLTQLQAHLAVWLFGVPAIPIAVTLACSGADVLALCVGTILAYPSSWRRRLAGAGGGVTLVLGLNTVRIGTLGLAATSPAWFSALHVYVWPAALILAVTGYVFTWMWLTDRPQEHGHRPEAPVIPDTTRATGAAGAHLAPRFIIMTAVCLVVFTAAAPLYLQSAGVLSVAAFMTREAAAVLRVFGLDAHAAGHVLWTDTGGFAMTQECISTPLIPIYAAAVFTLVRTWPLRVLGVLSAIPLFMGLGIARLLVVALPPTLIASPLSIVHAFYQVLLGVVVVAAAAAWRYGIGGRAWFRAFLGLAAGVAVAVLLGESYAHGLGRAAASLVSGIRLDDPQGAMTLLPAFQVGLYLALWVAALSPLGRARFWSGLALLGVVQLSTVAAAQVLASRADFIPHVRDVRAWAVVGPLVVIMAVESLARRHRAALLAPAVARVPSGG